MSYLEKRKNKKRYFINYISFAIYILLIMAVAYITPTEDVGLRSDAINSMNDEWSLIQVDLEPKNITLPFQAKSEVGEIVRIGKVLPEAFRYGQTIRLRSSMEEMRVYLNGETIYDNTVNMNKKAPYTPEASVWVLIDIPVEHDGSYLEIDVRSDIPYMSGTLNEVNYGARSNLIGQLVRSQKVSILAVLLILGVALFTFIISLSVSQLDTARLNYLSIFSLTIGVWILSELDILQIFVTNSYIVGTISYLLLPISAIAFILFMQEVVLHRYSKYLNILALSCGIFLCVSIIMQVFFGIHYIENWFVFLIVLILVVVSIVGLLFKELMSHNTTAGKYLLIIGVFLITVTIEIMMFLVGDFNDVSSLSKIGTVVFLLLLVLDTLHYLNQMIQKEGENRYLRDIAYKDPLTGGLNRAAFEKEVDRLLSLENQTSFRLTMFDLNNLKKINDHYGHEIGDIALKSFHQCITSTFEDKGRCYRVGGDEFMVIQNNISEEIYSAAINIIDVFMKDKEQDYGFHYGVAYGTDIYKYEQSFGEFKHHVDQNMYRKKRAYKLQLGEKV